MIVSASFRTDIPAFYPSWFRARFAAGHALVRNPYGGADYRVGLRDGVDGFVFWTRNADPFLPALAEVRAAGLPFVVQYTVTGYPRPLETSVVEPARAVACMRRLADLYGPRAVVWRYDPILDTSLTPAPWHLDNFARLADQLAGAVDEVTISFAHLYKKTLRNLDAAAGAHGFGWRDPAVREKQGMTARLAGLAAARGMALTLCSQPDYWAAGAAPAACIDGKRLADVGGVPFKYRRKGNRPGCLCAESRDIGAYHCCPHGCVYCYAVASRDQAKTRYQSHDPASESL